VERSRSPRNQASIQAALKGSPGENKAQIRQSMITRVSVPVDGGKINGVRGDGPNAIRVPTYGVRTRRCGAL